MRIELAFTDVEVAEALLRFAIDKGRLKQGNYSAYALLKGSATQEAFVFLKVRDVDLPREGGE